MVGISTFFATRLADDAAALWLLEDAEFVDAAMTTMVEGEVLQDDLMRFVLLLRQGFSKHYVLAAIARHLGAAFWPGRLPGVRRRLASYRMGCLPVVGRLMRLVFGLPGESISERRLRVMENQLYLLAKKAMEHTGEEAFPPAPWGGVHRMALLQGLLNAESRIPPEIRSTYVALMKAANRVQPDDQVN